MSKIAFALREDHSGTVEQDGETVPLFQGSVVARPDGTSYDIGAALTEGDGTIVTDDTDAALVALLDASPALKRTTVPDRAPKGRSSTAAHKEG